MPRNNPKTLSVKVIWDDDARVWSASSTDVKGLAIESKTTEDLIERLKVVIPELLELNHKHSAQNIPAKLHISGHQSLSLVG